MKFKSRVFLFLSFLISFFYLLNSTPVLASGIRGNTRDFEPKKETGKVTTNQKSTTDTQTASTPKYSGKTNKGGKLWEYKRKHFNMYSVKDEISIGNQVMDQQIKEFKNKKVAIDPPAYSATKSRIQNIVNRLAKVSDMPYLPYEVHIFDKPDVVNAYCLPGGKIAVFTGLFDKTKGLVNQTSDAEIAAVIGHEMAHATMRHVTRRLTTMNNLGFLGNLVSIGIGAGLGGNAQQIFGQVFNTGTMLYMPSYSRNYEKEADRVGFYYMALAGFDPNAAIQIWDRAAKQNKKGSDKTQFFDSHPANGERANALRAYLGDVAELKTNEKAKNKVRDEMRK